MLNLDTEILVRLPPKAVLRCRAVCPAWRRATSSRNFLRAHHARQPTLSLLRGGTSDSVGIIPFDHLTELATDQLQSIARLGPAFFESKAACDGLLILSKNCSRFCICNPATRQYAPLPRLRGFSLGGMYLHPPTGEYRLLMYKDMMYDELEPADEFTYHVYTIGSRQRPRHIGNVEIPDEWSATVSSSVLFHGNLHWYTGQVLMVFDTTAESFRQMRSPVVSGAGRLFEIDGILGVYSLTNEYSFNDGATIMDIWMVQDYESGLWALKHRFEFPVAELKAQFGGFCYGSAVVTRREGDELVLVRFGDSVLQIDTAGKVVASIHDKGLCPAGLQLQLKQTLVSHTFFPTLKGYVVNASPFL
ncbi:unnamed protein product [Alopecurus aequalis]